MKNKKWLVTIGEKDEEARTHLMSKLCVVQASPLNYMQFSKKKKINIPVRFPRGQKYKGKFKNAFKNDSNALKGEEHKTLKSIPSGSKVSKASLVDQNPQKHPNGSKATNASLVDRNPQKYFQWIESIKNIPQWIRNHHEHSFMSQDHQRSPQASFSITCGLPRGSKTQKQPP